MCVNWDKVQGQKLEGTIWREVCVLIGIKYRGRS